MIDLKLRRVHECAIIQGLIIELFLQLSAYQYHLRIERPPCNVNQILSTIQGLIHILPKLPWLVLLSPICVNWRLKTRPVVGILIKSHSTVGSLREAYAFLQSRKPAFLKSSSPTWVSFCILKA